MNKEKIYTIAIAVTILMLIVGLSFNITNNNLITGKVSKENSMMQIQDMLNEKSTKISNQIEQYLSSNPKLTLDDLKNDDNFRKLAIQPIDKTGYSYVIVKETGIIEFHPDKKIEGTSYNDLKEKFLEIWRIIDNLIKSSPCEDSGGIYEWEDLEGDIRPKYTYQKCVDGKTSDGYTFTVGAASYLDEYYSSNSNTLEQEVNLEMYGLKIASDFSDYIDERVKETLSFSEISFDNIEEAKKNVKEFSDSRSSEIWYNLGSDISPFEQRKTIPVYSEITFVDKNGNELIKYSNNEFSNNLKDISNPKNTQYKSEEYFQETKDSEKGIVNIGRVMTEYTFNEDIFSRLPESDYGKYEKVISRDTMKTGVIRFSTPVYKNGVFEGIVVLSLDYRNLQELSKHINPRLKEEVVSSRYDDSYLLVYDFEGDTIIHPKPNNIRGYLEDGSLAGYNEKNSKNAGAIFNLRKYHKDETYNEIARITLDEKETSTSTATDISGRDKMTISVPIIYSNKNTNYKDRGLFGGILMSIDLGVKDRASNPIEKESDLSLLSEKIHFELKSIENDLVFLSELTDLKQLKETNKEAKNRLEEIFLSLSKNKGIYYQTRYIDNSGKEIIRVDNVDNQATLIGEEKLQNKSGRYYFEDTLNMNKGDIFISPLDLNFESGELENRGTTIDPKYVPTVRYGTPVFNLEGEKTGIIILNVYANSFLELLSEYRDLYLVDTDGNFLYHPDESKTFGNILNTNYNIFEEFGGDIKKSSTSDLPFEPEDKSEYVFKKISPSNNGLTSYSWILIKKNAESYEVKNEASDLVILQSNFNFWGEKINDRLDLTSKIPSPGEFALNMIKTSSNENIENFKDQFKIVDGTWRTNLDYFNKTLETTDVPGVIIYTGFDLTDENKKIMLSLQRNTKTYSDATIKYFVNRYFTFENGLDSMYPKEWIFQVGHNDTSFDSLSYYTADPSHNPEKKSLWTGVYYDSVMGSWMISLISPIYDGNIFLGTTGGDVPLENLFSEIEDTHFKGNGNAFIFDSNKKIIMHSGYIDEIQKKAIAGNEELFTFDELGEKELQHKIEHINSDEGVLEYSENGEKYLLLYKKLENINWYYGFTIKSEVLENLDLKNYKKEGENMLDKTNWIFISIAFVIILFYIYFLLTPASSKNKLLNFSYRGFVFFGFSTLVILLSRQFISINQALYFQKFLYLFMLWFLISFAIVQFSLYKKRLNKFLIYLLFIINSIFSAIIIFTDFILEDAYAALQPGNFHYVNGPLSSIFTLFLTFYLVLSIFIIIKNRKMAMKKYFYLILFAIISPIIINIIYYLILELESMYLIMVSILILTLTLNIVLKKMHYVKEKRNNTLIILGIATIMIITLFIFNTYQTINSVEDFDIDSKINHLKSVAETKHLEVEEYLNREVQLMETIAANDKLTHEELINLIDIRSDLHEILILNGNGIVVDSSNIKSIGDNESEDPYYIEGKTKSYITGVYFSNSLGKKSVTMSTPYHGNVLVLRLNLDKINDLTINIQGLGETGEVLLGYERDDGSVEIFTDKIFNEKINSGIISKNNTVSPMVNAVNAVESIFYDSYDYRNVKVIAVTKYLEGPKIGLVVKMDESEVTSFSKNLSQKIWYYTFGIIGIVLLIGIAFIFVLTMSLRKDVKDKTVELEKTIRRLTLTKMAMLNMVEDINENNEKLKQLDKTKGEFLNMVSHELKTPLTAIIAHIGVIDGVKENLTTEEMNSFKAIERNSHNLKMLISNILEISRMEAGKFEITKTETDLIKLIKDSADNLNILAEQKGLKIEYKIKDIPKLVYLDDTRMHECINNFVTNAIKFTEKGKITISAEKKGKKIKISVTDTGIGIPEEKLNNLFHKFYQVDASISRRYGGTGLGLSITKKIVESHGGTVKVESKVGVGSTFSLEIPLEKPKKIKLNKANSKKDAIDPFAQFDERIKKVIKARSSELNIHQSKNKQKKGDKK